MMKWLMVFLLLGECAILGGQGVIVARSLREYETNEQIINAIHLNKLAKPDQPYTAEEWTMIVTIANQCPAAGGPAVYKMRGLYAALNDSLRYNNDSLCAMAGITMLQAPTQNGQTAIPTAQYDTKAHPDDNTRHAIMPNPATNSLQVIGQGRLRIINMLGTEALDAMLPNLQNQVDISRLPSGIYRCLITDESGIVLFKTTLSVVK